MITNLHAAQCGVPLSLMAYCDALGGPIPAARPTRLGVRWIVLERDLRAALEYRRRGELTIRGWLRSLAGPKVFGYWAWDDPRPALVRLLRTCAWWRRLDGRVARPVRRGLLALSHRLLRPPALAAR
jgi:predicted ATP-grasp superfamily ATP-dependent carboligase